MALNKEIIFGLSSLGDDDMLFPDFSRVIYTGNRWTATEDCFVVVNCAGADRDRPGGLSIDDVAVARPMSIGYNEDLVSFSSYVAKGSSLRGYSATDFTAYALKRGGRALFILSSPIMANLLKKGRLAFYV